MQIHGPADETDTADFRVYLNPGTDRPFASVTMGHVGFFAYTPEECDAAIRVWVEAKQLLLGTPGFSLCSARRLGDDYFTIYYCKLVNDGHVEHLARPRHEGDPDITWTDEAAQDDVAGNFGPEQVQP